MRRFALVFGVVYVVAGLLGFVPAMVYDAGSNWGPGGGYLFGTIPALPVNFPVNYLHDAVHVAVGVWGIWAFGQATRARVYARTLGVGFLALGAYGLLGWFGIPLPTDPLIPVGGNDAFLHLASGAVAAFFGFGPPARAVRDVAKVAA